MAAVPKFAASITVLTVMFTSLEAITESFSFDFYAFGQQPWSIFTATLVEKSLVSVLFTNKVGYKLACILFYGKVF